MNIGGGATSGACGTWPCESWSYCSAAMSNMRCDTSTSALSKLKLIPRSTDVTTPSTQASHTPPPDRISVRASRAASEPGRCSVIVGVRCGQPVAQAAQRLDARAPQLAPQAADEDFQRVAVGLVVEAVQRVLQRLAGVDAFRAAGHH